MQIPDSGAAPAPAAFGAPAPAQPLGGVSYAGLGPRFAAYLIDAVIISALYLGGLHVLVTRHVDMFGDTLYYDNAWWLDLGWLIVLTVYFTATWATMAATVGQRAVGLRVLRASDGARLDVGRSLLRVLGWVIASIPVGIGFIVAAADPRKQGWHDKIAGTVVVRKG